MSSVDKILERLDGVRGAAPKWSARCPAHDDRGPSLSIREGKDGNVLIHCFAGCEPLAVLEAVGLGWSDLFEKTPEPSRGHGRPRWNYRELLQDLHREALVVLMASNDIIEGRKLTKVDMDRVIAARKRIEDISVAAR